jgi:hypothetical protein
VDCWLSGLIETRLNSLSLDREKSVDNAFDEFFDGRFREERLRTHRFDLLDDAKEEIDHCSWNCNRVSSPISRRSDVEGIC